MTNLVRAMATGTFAPTLGSLANVLDKGAAHAVIQGWPADRLPQARLAPDMYELTRQVQIACDHAKNGVGRLTGVEAPAFEDVEQTIEDLKSRISRTIEFLDGVPEAAFDGATGRQIVLPLQGTMTVAFDGLQYLRDWALPHFYFHVVTAYDILRASGVELGKADFLAHIAYAIRSGG
jgi:hypothetical protein